MEKVRAPCIGHCRVGTQYSWSVCGYAFDNINIYAKPNWYQRIKMVQCVRIGVSSHSSLASGTALDNTMAIIPNMASHQPTNHFTLTHAHSPLYYFINVHEELLVSHFARLVSSHCHVHEYEKLFSFYCIYVACRRNKYTSWIGSFSIFIVLTSKRRCPSTCRSSAWVCRIHLHRVETWFFIHSNTYKYRRVLT